IPLLLNEFNSDKRNHDEKKFELKEQYDKVVLHIQISIQNLKKMNSILEDKKNIIPKLKDHLELVFQKLKISKLNSLLNELMDKLSKLPLEKTRVEMMKNLYPIVNYLLSLIRIYQYPFLCIHKSISKLTFIVMKI